MSLTFTETTLVVLASVSTIVLSLLPPGVVLTGLSFAKPVCTKTNAIVLYIRQNGQSSECEARLRVSTKHMHYLETTITHACQDLDNLVIDNDELEVCINKDDEEKYDILLYGWTAQQVWAFFFVGIVLLVVSVFSLVAGSVVILSLWIYRYVKMRRMQATVTNVYDMSEYLSEYLRHVRYE